MNIKYSNGTVTPDDVIKFLSLTDQSDGIIRHVILYREAAKKAAELGLIIPDEDLQQYADNFRKMHGLIAAEDTYAFLSGKGLTEDDFEHFCEGALSIIRFKEHLSDKNKIEEYFVNNRSDFDRARISKIVVKDANLANEIIIQVSEEGEDFHALARRYSIDMATKYSGGYIGEISRKTLDQGAAAKVFNASQGDLLGPFERDGIFQLILIEEIKKAELGDNVIELIKERLFNDWFSQIIKEGFEISV
ncbi:MAG: peptidylprolyl isomerase [Deltaproteobacteria bacterium]|nr:peptidylprolyl isomerase [Deltaproteobacteria bacterium]